MVVIILLASVWGGVWWRFRGGALTAMTGWDPGTGGMRAIAAVALSAPLVALGGVWWGLMVPALWVGWSIAGWGAFQSMGTQPVEMKNPVARALSHVLPNGAACIVGMAIEGCYALALPGVVAGWVDGAALTGLLVMLSGAAFSPIYWIADNAPRVPNWGRFALAHTEWAEVGVGAWVGAVLVLAA